MRHHLSGLTIALFISCISIAHARPSEEPIYSPTGCALLRIDPKDGSTQEFLKLDHTNLTAPAVVGNSLYVGDDSGILHARAAQDGSKIWEFKADTRIGCLAATDKMVYIASGRLLRALDVTSGHPVWARESDEQILDITLVDGTVLINTKDGPVAMEQTTGVPRWQLEVKWNRFVFSPLPDKRLCVWKTDEIFVVATDSGKTLWHKVADQLTSAPGALPTAAVGRGELICQLRGSPRDAEDWALHALDAGSGRQVWSVPLGQYPAAGAQTSLFGNTAYAIIGGKIHARDTFNGEKKWEYATQPLEIGGPGLLETHGHLYIPELGGGISALDAKTGTLLWSNVTPKPARHARTLIGGIAANETALFATRNKQLEE